MSSRPSSESRLREVLPMNNINFPQKSELEKLKRKYQLPMDINIGRMVGLSFLEGFLTSGPKLQSVGIVGGSIEDLEVRILRDFYPHASFEILGIELSETFLDLNQGVSITRNFDLLLCTNVLEHVYEHQNFAKNLKSLAGESGYVWLSVPFSDMYHGAPEFYSSGYDPKYVSQLLKQQSFEIRQAVNFGSERLYLFTHLLHDWPGMIRYYHPLLGQLMWLCGLLQNPRPPIKRFLKSFWMRRIIVTSSSTKFDSDPLNSTTTFVIAQKISMADVQ